MKKLNAINLDTLQIDTIEYKTIYDFEKREQFLQYLYDLCFLNEELFQKYLIEYRNNTLSAELTQQDMEMLFSIKSIKEIYNNYKKILADRLGA